MAHGSNEINVSAPLAASMFMLDNSKLIISQKTNRIAILIGLSSLVLGSITLGKRYLHKYRQKFMSISLANGCIANTCVAIILLTASFTNFTVSCSNCLASCLYLLR
mmetsp:Transcript_87839/g.121000  ORF Transcript_87839/g.121000 Transcript_87839/m.121000 type:complete len:107 (+) Transcript_87839:1316-1636(+)